MSFNEILDLAAAQVFFFNGLTVHYLHMVSIIDQDRGFGSKILVYYLCHFVGLEVEGVLQPLLKTLTPGCHPPASIVLDAGGRLRAWVQ